MSVQLRVDLDLALNAARDRVKAHKEGAPNLVEGVMQLVDGAFRFLEQDPDIKEARRALLERLENAALLMDPKKDLDVPAPAEGRPHRGIATARAHAVEAISRLQAVVLDRGRINAAGDRVGLGKMGALLR